MKFIWTLLRTILRTGLVKPVDLLEELWVFIWTQLSFMMFELFLVYFQTQASTHQLSHLALLSLSLYLLFITIIYH